MCSVISVLPVHGNVVHFYLLYLWAEVVLASLDGAAPIGTGVWEIVGTILVGETDNAPALALCGTEIMRGLAVFVKMAQYLAVPAGVVATVAG
jgi:hypothetical protein